MKIEPGMLVRITGCYRGKEALPELKAYIGHVGKVLRFSRITRGEAMWDIEGAEPERLQWCERFLEPINPDNKTNGLSYSDVIEGINSIGVPATPVKADVNHD